MVMMTMRMQQNSRSLLVLLLVVFIAGIVLSGPSPPRRSRVRRQNMKVRINATGDTIVMTFLRPNADTKLEGYILGYGSSMFSKQFIQLPENGQPYETEFDAEPKYLIAVQPIPTNEVKKQCTGKVELQKPLHLVIGSVTPTSVLLSWGTLLKTPYEGNIMNECLEDGHYTVRYREKNRKWNYQTCPTSDTVIDNLKPNVVYEFGVQPNAKDATGMWSRPVIHNISTGGIEEKAIRKIFKRPFNPVKPLTPGPRSFPFAPRHVFHNKTQGRLPISRNIATKATLAPTTTTRQESLSTPGPTTPMVTKQPIDNPGEDLSRSVLPPFLEIPLAPKFHPPLHITPTMTSVPFPHTNVEGAIRDKHEGYSLSQPQQKPITQPLPNLQLQPHYRPPPQPKPQPQQPQLKSHVTAQPQPKTYSQNQPQSQPLSTSQPITNSRPQHEPESEPIPKTQPQPEPTSKLIPKSQPQQQPRPTSQTVSHTQPQPQPTLKIIPQTHTQPPPKSTSKHIIQTQSQPTSQPIIQTQSQPTSQPIIQTQSHPTSQPTPQTQPQLQTTSQYIPQIQPQPLPQPTSQFKHQTQSQPPPKSTSKHIIQTQSQPQPTSQPTPQTQPQLQTTSQFIPQTQPQTLPLPTSQFIHQTQSQPQPQPTSQPIPQTQPQLQPQPTFQPIPLTPSQTQPQPPLLTRVHTQSQTQSQQQTHFQSEPQITTQLRVDSQPQSTQHPKHQAQHQTQPQIKTQTTLQPSPQSTPITHPHIPSLTPQHIPHTNQALPRIPIQSQSQSQSTAQPQTQTKPQPKTNLQPPTQTQPTSKPKIYFVEIKPKTQPKSKSQPKPKTELQPKSQPTSKTQPKPKSQPKPKTQPKPKSKPKPKTQPKPKSQSKPETQPQPKSKPQPKPIPNPKKQPKPHQKKQQKPQPKPKSRDQQQPQAKTQTQTLPPSQPIPQPHPSSKTQTASRPQSHPQLGPSLQPQTGTYSEPTRVTPREKVPTAPSPPEVGKPLPRPALATEKAGSHNLGTGILRPSIAEVPRSPISSSVPAARRNTTLSRTRVHSTRIGVRPVSPSKTLTSSHSSSTPGADGTHHRANALPKPVVWSKENPVLHPPIPVNKRPNLVGKPSDHDKPMDLKQGDKESILKPFPLVTAKPKQERRQQTATSAPAVNSSHFDIYENSSIFRPLPASDIDIMGKKRFVAPHVIYKTDKKPDEPCSITSSLSFFPDEEGSDQNVTGPPRIPPSNLTVVTVEGCPSFVILDWQKSDNETREYEVVSTAKGPNGQEVSILTTNQTHTAVENLKPESNYEFKVTPKNELGTGPSTDPVTFSTESADPRVSEYVAGKDAIWTQFPFKADAYSECNGKQFVKRTWYRKFVGIQLCNSLRYKIYLSDSLNGKFYHIGDQTGHGEDHCQFVDSFLDGRTGTQMLADQLPSKLGFFRALRQEPVHFGEIGGKSHITYVGWYECGTPIPGKW
ncbi:target of Nesh-SH3 isoform X2 [Scophthalmus maximus]|uniref:target of Nesh-SH3 isoform X2 n=1 Tax=Scophthalmus maximus TaxID=52904 RepID=UPI001FA8B96B|nr:target of Nesh-SH3 isoform X2 [Scophthalmus maximus]